MDELTRWTEEVGKARMLSEPIYLDYNATTPVLPEVGIALAFAHIKSVALLSGARFITKHKASARQMPQGAPRVGKLLIVCTALLGIVLIVACGRPSVPNVDLPAELATFSCQQDSRFIASEGYEVAQVGATLLALPCREAGSIGDLGKEWQTRSAAQRYAEVSFLKRADGSFMVSEEASAPLPSSATIQYTVRGTYGTENRPGQGFEGLKGTRRVIELNTPAAFARGGPMTTFECLDSGGRYRSCVTQVQSNALFWNVLVTFGQPLLSDDAGLLQVDLLEALELLGAHIARQ